MSCKALALIGCRIVALFAWVFALSNLGTISVYVWNWLAAEPDLLGRDFFSLYIAYALTPLLTELAAGCFLWFGAAWLADQIVAPLPLDEVPVPFDARIVLAMACVIVGLMFLVRGVAGLFALVTHLVTGSELDWPGLIAATVHTACGIALLACPGRASRFLMKLQSTTGPKYPGIHDKRV